MVTLFGNLFSLIKESTGSSSKVSSARVQAYFVLFSTLAYSVTFVIIEIANAVMSLTQGVPYAPSNESIVVLGMLLSHHLGLMFSKKSNQPNLITPVGLRSASTSTTTTSSTTMAAPAVAASLDDAGLTGSVTVEATTQTQKAKIVVDDPDADYADQI